MNLPWLLWKIACFGKRPTILDIAVFISRHKISHWSPPTLTKTMLWPKIQNRRCRVAPELCSKNQLCVPTMFINGESFRLKDKRKAGLLAAPVKTGKR